MQTPYGDEGNYQDYQIGGDIDDTCANQNSVFIDTLLALSHQGIFSDTLECDGQDKSNGVEQIPPECQPDGPPDARPAGAMGDKEALVQQDDRSLSEEHSHSRNDLDVMKKLMIKAEIRFLQAFSSNCLQFGS